MLLIWTRLGLRSYYSGVGKGRAAEYPGFADGEGQGKKAKRNTFSSIYQSKHAES